MEEAGSRDIPNKYMGSELPSPHPYRTIPTELNHQENVTDPLDFLNPSLSNLGQEYALGNKGISVSLSVEEQNIMMKSIQEIFELEEEVPDVKMRDDGKEGDEPKVDLDDQQRRTERLKGVLSTLAQLWWSGSEYVDMVAEKLADGSRDPKWRIPLGKSGVLSFFLEILSGHALQHTLKIHVLRLIGNSCADTDENRARVVASNYLPSIISQLKDSSLLPFVIPVLYNICIDYEPAQQQASNLFLCKELIELISSSRFDDSRAFLGYTCQILDLLIAQPSEPVLAPENTAIILLRISADRESPTDMDDFIALVNTAVAYLQHAKFQKALITHGALDTTLVVLVDSYTRFDSHPSIGSPSNASSSPDQDDAKLLSEMRSNLNQVLSDVSALSEFKEAIPIVSPFSSSLRRWLSSPQLQLQVCACIMLGNLARSDAACEEFVHISQVHKPLITVLANANDSQILHAALGFLKNLALPVKNKEALGDAGIFEVLPRLWLFDTLQQIQFSSISLARQLCVGTFENVRHICQRLSDDKDSPANMRSNLSLLIALFDRTDIEPIKMEISRLITAVCRVFSTYKGRSPDEMKRIRKKFLLMHPDIGKPLGFMVSQTKWPVVRSEGWFVFALMARFPEGAQCISDLMQDIAVFQPLVEMLTGKTFLEKGLVSSPSSEITEPSTGSASGSGGEISWEAQKPEGKSPAQAQGQEAEMARIDRENALVLINELLKNRGNEMAAMRRTLFEDLLRGGSEIIKSYQEASPAWRAITDVVSKERRISAELNLQQIAEQSTHDF